jgi:alpha-tubulin suppressor-like RCC1 family protein
VYSWGFGVEGQLGHGRGDALSIPTLIENLPNEIIDIGAYMDQSIALTSKFCNSSQC